MNLISNDPVKNFFQIPLVRFGVHVVLLSGLILIVTQYWKNYQEKQEIQRLLDYNMSLASANSLLKIQKDYFESNIYAEKSAKEAEWKNRGEIVVNTGRIEPAQPEKANDYIPDEQKITEDNNPKKWFQFLFGV